MKPMDWQVAVPRSPDVGRVQQVAAAQGGEAQEYLARVGRVQARKTPRVKEGAGPSALRDRPGGGSGRDKRPPRRQPGGVPEGGAQAGGRATHLDVRV